MRSSWIVILLAWVVASSVSAQEVVVTNLDRFPVATQTLQRVTAAQWFAVGFTTDGNSYQL